MLSGGGRGAFLIGNYSWDFTHCIKAALCRQYRHSGNLGHGRATARQFFLKAGQVLLGALALAEVALPQRSQTESNLGILLVVKPAEDPLVARTGSMQIW